MQARVLVPAILALALLAVPGGAAAADYVPGEVIVHYKDGTSSSVHQDVEQESGTQAEQALPNGSAELQIQDGDSVGQTIDELRNDPKVAYAVPNYVAHMAGFVPNDPGFHLQWNFSGPNGINMPDAWAAARGRGAPDGRGVVVAVADTGVAYRRFKHYRRAPDLSGFVPGYDFVDDDRYPFDLNGHGTHVTGTIAETTNNRIGAAGIASRAKIMPLRVLDSEGNGDTAAIARAIRYAAKRRADIINLSFEFATTVRASEIPDVLSAIRYAYRRGMLVVGAAGNQADASVAYPARASHVVSVAATTERGCEADYSNAGVDLDIAAPGGGVDAANQDTPYDSQVCRPDASGKSVFQETFTSNLRRFGLPSGYEGTSMASPHVTGVAALLIGSGELGPDPSPPVVERKLELSARDIGAPGRDDRYGFGLLDASRALTP